MRVSRHLIKLLLYILLLTLLAIPAIARVDDDDEDDDYDVKARVVRISMLSGEVNLKRNGNKDFEPAKLNYPLVEGDTIATAKDSNLEIQVDSRNFVRLAPNSVLRIITLRDEGIAISVVEGTATVRLAKFDRKNGYFEIDAPKTTMTAEKEGLYRIDVPRDGRVRLTVRDGGAARIYSDTSGFTLRDGRSAELVVTGENAGDWDFMAAASNDAIDAWVSDRERYLAQRLKYNVKYYDESVWGAEDLEAYGDWNHTDEFGWIWRPHNSFISTYADWAPYRYGNWTWCPPYGWTWVGFEPWGWAPYHYGRWVFHNNYWAWAPRSQFQRKRSWWRPALVAFVVNFSFGDNICWYPLSYYHRDPHSNRYRHRDRDRNRDRDGYRGRDRGRDRDRDGRGGYRHPNGDPRGVTLVPRGDFGNPDRRGQAVEEPIARRVVDVDPESGDRDLPRSDNRERWGRSPRVDIPERGTGAAERTPGVRLDEDLRRSRVLHGREPKAREVVQPSAPAVTTPTTTPAPAAVETQPTGAVTRPEPRPSRRDRDFDRSDRSDRSDAPRETPRDRRERDTPRSESPRSESPRSEAPRSEPRHESPRSEPAPRSDPPPRADPPSRPDPPRAESPRSVPDKPDRPMF